MPVETRFTPLTPVARRVPLPARGAGKDALHSSFTVGGSMKTMSWRWALALVMALGVAAPADAQGRRDRDRDDRYERSDDHRYGERQGRDRVKHGDRDDRRVMSRRDDD